VLNSVLFNFLERAVAVADVATPNASQTEQLIFKHESPHVWRQTNNTASSTAGTAARTAANTQSS